MIIPWIEAKHRVDLFVHVFVLYSPIERIIISESQIISEPNNYACQRRTIIRFHNKKIKKIIDRIIYIKGIKTTNKLRLMVQKQIELISN